MFKRRSKARSLRTKENTGDYAPVNAAGSTEGANTALSLDVDTSHASDAVDEPPTGLDPSLDTLTLSENRVGTPEKDPLTALPLDSQGPSPNPLPASASEISRRQPRGKSRTKASVKSMLSFMDQASDIGAGEDEEIEVFTIKKTKASRKFAQRKDRMTKFNLALSTISAAASPRPEYSQEALAQLKQSTFKGISTESAAASPRVTSSSSLASILDQINEQVQQGKTPDSSLIREARRYREQLRQQGEETTVVSHESDFISLSAGSKAPMSLGQMAVVDEEDIFDEESLRNNGVLDDEAAFDEDLVLGDKAVLEHETQERLAKEQALADASETEVLDGDDDEVRRWEMDQIRNGSDGRAASVFKHDKETITHKVTNAIKVIPIPSMSEFRRQMQKRLANLQDIQATNEHELTRVTNEMDKARESLASLATKRQTLRERHGHYSKLLQDSRQLAMDTTESAAPNASIASPSASPQANE
ncbi:hypothetical protein H4R35_005333 [Dimargaris xerosporica]|nr:hypothetical protein H4R35_005333 [Dimargaris xerosporica]